MNTDSMVFDHIYDWCYGNSMGQRRTKQCPTCGKSAAWKGNPYRPFCSERCKLIDLGQWATEKYRIPVKGVSEEEKKEEEKEVAKKVDEK
jgi:hypothetical protein